MDAAAFEQVYAAFGDFHAYFAPLFGRSESRDHSQNYLRALLVQSQDRRNAENLSESVGVSARAMQRFLTKAPWDDDAVMGRLQEYLSPRLGHPEAVWVLDGSDFPKQGRKSAGVARQYCRETGQGGQLPGRDVPGLCQPVGTSAGGQTAVSAGELDVGQRPLCGGRSSGGETGLPVEDGTGARDVGAGGGGRPSEGGMGCRGRRLRDVAVFAGGAWRPWGCATCWTFRRALRCGRWSRRGPLRSIRDGVVPDRGMYFILRLTQLIVRPDSR